jgi:hypothetical protein
MTARFSLIIAALGAAFVVAVPAWGQTAPPDAFERALAASGADMLEVRERALLTNRGNAGVTALEARERAFAAKREAQLAKGGAPDWFERIVAAHQPPREPVVDDRFRIDPTSSPTQATATSSDRSIEWPQVGVGLVIGIALMLGLYLVVTREREPAV